MWRRPRGARRTAARGPAAAFPTTPQRHRHLQFIFPQERVPGARDAPRRGRRPALGLARGSPLAGGRAMARAPARAAAGLGANTLRCVSTVRASAPSTKGRRRPPRAARAPLRSPAASAARAPLRSPAARTTARPHGGGIPFVAAPRGPGELRETDEWGARSQGTQSPSGPRSVACPAPRNASIECNDCETRGESCRSMGSTECDDGGTRGANRGPSTGTAARGARPLTQHLVGALLSLLAAGVLAAPSLRSARRRARPFRGRRSRARRVRGTARESLSRAQVRLLSSAWQRAGRAERCPRERRRKGGKKGRDYRGSDRRARRPTGWRRRRIARRTRAPIG